MPTRRKHARAASRKGLEYFVLTVSELDVLVYRELRKLGAARDFQEETGQYTITDPQKARSQVILPRILNPLGRQGWRLCAVNNMECYIFVRYPGSGKRYEYKVATPADLDRKGLEFLDRQEALRISENGESQVPVVEIVAPEKARIQNVLPAVLGDFARQGWELVAINGPQLYFFVRTLDVN